MQNTRTSYYGLVKQNGPFSLTPQDRKHLREPGNAPIILGGGNPAGTALHAGHANWLMAISYPDLSDGRLSGQINFTSYPSVKSQPPSRDVLIASESTSLKGRAKQYYKGLVPGAAAPTTGPSPQPQVMVQAPMAGVPSVTGPQAAPMTTETPFKTDDRPQLGNQLGNQPGKRKYEQDRFDFNAPTGPEPKYRKGNPPTEDTGMDISPIEADVQISDNVSVPLSVAGVVQPPPGPGVDPSPGAGEVSLSRRSIEAMPGAWPETREPVVQPPPPPTLPPPPPPPQPSASSITRTAAALSRRKNRAVPYIAGRPSGSKPKGLEGPIIQLKDAPRGEKRKTGKTPDTGFKQRKLNPPRGEKRKTGKTPDTGFKQRKLNPPSPTVKKEKKVKPELKIETKKKSPKTSPRSSTTQLAATSAPGPSGTGRGYAMPIAASPVTPVSATSPGGAEKKVMNPLTGKRIKVGSKAYKELVQRKVIKPYQPKTPSPPAKRRSRKK